MHVKVGVKTQEYVRQALEINPDQELGGHSKDYLPVVRTLDSPPSPVLHPPSAGNEVHHTAVHLDG